MINEIENSLVALITSRLESARKIGVQKGIQGLAQPAVYASIEEGKFEKHGQKSVQQYLKVYLDIIFSNLKDQRSRREGINLILEGAVQLLLFNNLGLQIAPLEPKNWRNTTTTELDELGMISYSLELSTSYFLTKSEDEAVTDLLSVGLSLYLADPADETADATDIVALPELPKGLS